MNQTSRAAEPQRRWISVRTASELTELTQETIRRHVADGTLPGYRMGGKLIRIDRDELEAAMRPYSGKDTDVIADQPPTPEQRRAAQLKARDLIKSLLEKDYVKADSIVPVVGENAITLELAGLFVQLLESDRPAQLLNQLRQRIVKPPTD